MIFFLILSWVVLAINAILMAFLSKKTIKNYKESRRFLDRCKEYDLIRAEHSKQREAILLELQQQQRQQAGSSGLSC
jgi:CelD/BcsL family acetyltransferase involved in cellulose biosynthesis